MSTKDTFASKQEVETFYNQFKEKQKVTGVNIRHRTIFKKLRALGLKSNSNVLEVGCGIGTVSGLIIKYINQGQFLGVDISETSIRYANEQFAAYKNASFVVNDMSEFSTDLKFDFVVLPDVLEHIPVQQHSNLFKVLAKLTTQDAVLLINIPEPNCLNWIRNTHPEKLQIIDQSLSMQDLLNNAYPHGFKLHQMYAYSLQYTTADYATVVFKKNMEVAHYERKSWLNLAWNNFLSKL